MNDQPNDGGPAFPVVGFNRDLGDNVSKFEMAPNGGMSLRDWFAGQALAGLCTDDGWPADTRADAAYDMADAMLERRAK